MEDFFDINDNDGVSDENSLEEKEIGEEETLAPDDPPVMDFSAISDIIEQAENEKNEKSAEEDKDDEDTGNEEAEKDEGFIKVTESGDVKEKENRKKKNRFISKEKLGSVKDKIKDSKLLDSDTLKDMFFGTQTDEKKSDTSGKDADEEFLDEDEESQPILFDKSRKKRITADPKQDKMIFSFEYMVTPEQAADGYTLFYNEFVKPRNVKFTLLFGAAAAVFLISAIAGGGYVNLLLLLVCLSVIALMWLNSYNARKESRLLADDVKNDSYKLSFYNSRILIEASELAGDRVYHYSPVMIRFEDIELRVIDYEEIYVLIFKKDYIYTVPKKAMTEQMNTAFKNHMSNILGDDYREYYTKQPRNGSKIKQDPEESSGTERE